MNLFLLTRAKKQSGLKEILITLHTPPKSKWKKSSRQKALKRFAKKIKFNLLKNHLNNLEFETKFGKKLFCKVVCNDYSINSNGREKNVDGIPLDIKKFDIRSHCGFVLHNTAISFNNVPRDFIVSI